MKQREDVMVRLARRCVVTPEGCWEFTGSRFRGYGKINMGGKNGPIKLTHRVAYEYLVGPVPEGLDLDHLCRNRSCCNPEHLEPVTRSENLRRSPLMGRYRLAITHCPEGHPYDEANTYRNPQGRRSCRTCMSKEYRAKRAERKAQR